MLRFYEQTMKSRRGCGPFGNAGLCHCMVSCELPMTGSLNPFSRKAPRVYIWIEDFLLAKRHIPLVRTKVVCCSRTNEIRGIVRCHFPPFSLFEIPPTPFGPGQSLKKPCWPFGPGLVRIWPTLSAWCEFGMQWSHFSARFFYLFII